MCAFECARLHSFVLFDANLYIVGFVMCIGQAVCLFVSCARTYMHIFVIRTRYKFYAFDCVYMCVYQLQFRKFSTNSKMLYSKRLKSLPF